MGASEVWSSVPAWLAIAVGLAAVVSSSEAHVFYAGGHDGWVLDPTESYNHWAGRSRFQVNDTIGNWLRHLSSFCPHECRTTR